MARHLPRNLSDFRRDWALLTIYQRFETAVALVLTLLIASVVVVALYRLTVGVVATLILRSLNPLDHAVFQDVFGQIMTVLIALEFNHTLQHVIRRERGIIQAKIVILIALLAVVRRIIVAEVYATTPAGIGALGFLILSLGATYWLIREPDRRLPRGSDRPGTVPSAA
jgi:uncharacterized membrane protein (DUF373 family)